MAHGIINLDAVAAQANPAFNRNAIGAADLDNGSVFQLLTKSADADKTEVWVATAPASTTGLQNLWMAYEPVQVLTASKYLNLDIDPRNFVNLTGRVFSAFKPAVADLITLTTDVITGSTGSYAFVVATAADYKLNSAAAAVSGLSLKKVATSYISIGTGSIDAQRTVAYQFEVVAIA